MLCPLPWPSQSRLMLTSKELIPLSESHMTLPLKGPDMDLHAYTFLSTFEPRPQHVWHYELSHNALLCSSQARCALRSVDLFFFFAEWISPSRSACVECFALVWHHSFIVDNLHGADYSPGQRKHTAFYWLTAAKLLLCKRLIFAGISKWNIS